MSWSYHIICRNHDKVACDCDDVDKYDGWILYNDRREEIGSVVCFNVDENGKDGPFYGNTLYGRTGPVGNRLDCQKMVEKMIEDGAREARDRRPQ